MGLSSIRVIGFSFFLLRRMCVPKQVPQGGAVVLHVVHRAGTGSNISGLGRARALGFGLGSGSGFPKFGFKPVGLRIFCLSLMFRLALS